MPRSSTPIGCRPRSVFRNRPPSRTVRSPPSTRTQDSSRASSTWPYQAGSAWPGVSSAAVPRRRGIRRSMSRQSSTNGSMWQSSCEANSSGTHATEPPAVLQRVRKAIGKPGAIRQHMPRAVRRTHQVGGIELQQARRIAACAARPQEGRIGIDQRRRQRAIGQQVAAARRGRPAPRRAAARAAPVPLRARRIPTATAAAESDRSATDRAASRAAGWRRPLPPSRARAAGRARPARRGRARRARRAGRAIAGAAHLCRPPFRRVP